LNIPVSVEKTVWGGIMGVVAFKAKSQMLAEQYGWPLSAAQGYVDGETFRKRHRPATEHVLVGIDEYSLGFRAGYFNRALSSYTPTEIGLSLSADSL
jgi:hypothetical protein